VPAAAHPSCQTVYCHHDRDLRDRADDAGHLEDLARDPRNFARWQAVFQDLVGKLERERGIARYVAHVDWEARPELEIDLEARLRAERAAWIADWKQAFPDRGEPWCAEATLEEAPAARVELLRIAAARLEDDVTVQVCLGQALHAVGRPDEEEALVADFLARHPDEPVAHAQRIALLRSRGAPPEEIRAALEERARGFEDDRYARRDLLQFYDANGLDAPRDRLLAALEADAAGDVDARKFACDALVGSKGFPGAYSRCLTRVLADFPPSEMPEEDRWRLDSVRDGLLMRAIHARDWPAINGLLAGWPAEKLGDAWRKVADWTNEEGCRALRAAWTEGTLRPALAGPHAANQAGRLAWAFQDCHETALAQEVERPFVAGASDADLAQMASDAAREERERRAVLEPPQDPATWYDVDDTSRPLAERLPHLLAWYDAVAKDPEPALRLSNAYAAAGNGEEAVRWLVEAAGRHPWRGTDLLLQAAALALRFRLHDAAAANARKVLAAPASPRQHAEAHYVLGRVALREGRREEAAGELLRYFPLRMRYVAACGASPDRGLVLLLLANYDLPRLRLYLEERNAALAWYREHLYAGPPEPGSSLLLLELRRRYYEPLACLSEPLPPPLEPQLTLACVPAGVYDYLAKGGANAASAGERARRRREAKAGTACPPGWGTEFESLFDDERLLSYSEKLTTMG